MIINHNAAASRAHLNYSNNLSNINKTFETLSSGERINKASDDPAGLAVSEKFRSQISGLKQSQRNIQDGISFIQTAEGYLTETNNILQRMRELSVQAANGTYTAEDRAQINVEFDQMVKELNRIHEDSKFNTIRIFDGYSLGQNSFGANDDNTIAASRNPNFNSEGAGLNGLVIQSGANTDERTFIQLDATNSYTLGLTDQPTTTYADNSEVNNGNLAYRELSFFDSTEKPIEDLMYLESGIRTSAIEENSGEPLSISYFTPKEGTRIDLSTPERATETITVLDVALNKVNKERASLGAYQNRLETAQRGTALSIENLQAAESRIRDADMAKEYTKLVKYNILTESSSSMAAQANTMQNSILRIIR